MEEIFKDIKLFENLYQISNLGNIKSITRNKLLKLQTSTYGYKTINLHKNNIQYTFTIHRLVANAFISNINNFPEINHKDGNKENNTYLNLEWCTRSYNMKHLYDIGIRNRLIIDNKAILNHYANTDDSQYTTSKKFNISRTPFIRILKEYIRNNPNNELTKLLKIKLKNNKLSTKFSCRH